MVGGALAVSFPDRLAPLRGFVLRADSPPGFPELEEIFLGIGRGTAVQLRAEKAGGAKEDGLG